MSNYRITNRYATALLELSIEEKALDLISNDLEIIGNSIRKSKELSLLINSPIIKLIKKKDLITKIFSNKVSSITLRFLDLVIDRNRASLIPEIIEQFFNIRDQHLGIVNVFVLSAAKFDENQSNNIIKQLEKYTNKKVRINFSLDSSLKGGFVIQLGDTVLNASLRHQLDILKHKFLHGTQELN
jgi:F-type H+-transporting ATPase subunit delta